MITRTRGYIPHAEIPQRTYFVTFRLHDSLPQSVFLRFKHELEFQKRSKNCDPLVLFTQYEEKIENYLDSSYGQCWLRDAKIAKLAVDALRKNDGISYTLHAYTVMPNHVHTLFSLKGNIRLSEVMRQWKGSTSFLANQVLQRSGAFWQREYFDKVVKSNRQFEYTIRYIFRNPVKAGLCKEIFEWPWSAASIEIQYLLRRFFL